MKSCVFCKFRYQKGSGIAFHKFPIGPLKQLWIKNMKFENWSPRDNDLLCSKHFIEDCFIRHVARTTLISGSVPTLFSDAENKPSAQVTLLDTDAMTTAAPIVSVEKVGMKWKISNNNVDQTNIDLDDPSRTQKKFRAIAEVWLHDHHHSDSEPTNLLESSSSPLRDTVVTPKPNVSGTIIKEESELSGIIANQKNGKLKEPDVTEVIERIKLEHSYEDTPSASKIFLQIQENIKHDHHYESTPGTSQKALQRVKKSLKISRTRLKVMEQHLKGLKISVSSLKMTINDLKKKK